MTDTTPGLYIDGLWRSGSGESLQSINPADESVVWEGATASADDVDRAIAAARKAFPAWARTPLAERRAICERFAGLVKDNAEHIASCISREMGKPLWETRTEAAAMAGKIAISIKAQDERAGTRESDMAGGTAVLRHRPHGVAAVFGPYNFPAHLPNGHIVPALLAGNTVVFKSSELTPLVGIEAVKLWEQAGLPPGVLNLVTGALETGKALASQPGIDALLFTGSAATGKLLHEQAASQPGKMLALEMGGNNPLVVDAVADRDAAVHSIVQSAFLSSGQRCTCARRLYVPLGDSGDTLLERLVEVTRALRIDRWNAEPAPFMGPVVSAKVAGQILAAQDALIDKGGVALLRAEQLSAGPAYVSPGIIDLTAARDVPDQEYFGPLLSVYRTGSFDQAIAMANDTRFGLSAGLLADDPARWEQFRDEIRAGIVNWNQQTTGASGSAPFGGPGDSGNLRPSAYYAADYCAYPMASIEKTTLDVPETLSPGLTLP